MKPIFTLISISFSLLFCGKVHAQNWLKTIGGGNSDVPYAIAQDGNKNIYIGGAFSGANVNFNPGGTAINLTTTLGADNGFVAKYSSIGVLEWAIPFYRGSGGTRINSIITDPSNNMYVTGWFDGTNVNFNPNATASNQSSTGSQDIFLAKYNSAGILQWVRMMGGGTLADQGNGLAYDANDNTIVLTGTFMTTTNFNPGGSAINLTPAGGAVAGNSEIFIAKYNTSGICQWVRQMGAGTGSDVSNTVAVDGSGNIIIGGWFLNSNVNFNPGGTPVLRSSAGTTSDMFLAKYNNTGILQWIVATGGTTSTDAVNGVAVDASGNVYAAGNFSGTGVNFNPNGTSTTFSANATDAFLAKYNSSGVLQWAKTAGGSGSDRGRCVSVSPAGNVYYGGQFVGTGINFNVGGTALPLTSLGTDAFFISYTSSGTLNWGMAIGGIGSDDMKGFAIDNSRGKIYTAGQYSGLNMNFDPLNSTGTTQTTTGVDVVLARYNMSNGLLSFATLPVSWTNINAEKNGEKILLRWQTSCEINNSGFAIERSTDGNVFQYAGYMASTAAADCGKATYLFEDRFNNFEGKLYYRLKQTDIDGKYSYSKIVWVSNNDNVKASVHAYPNPAKNNFTIARYGDNAADKAVIYSNSGKLLTRLQLNSYNNVDCSSYAPGIYYINYYKDEELIKSEKMVINR